ncbi:DUF4249 family protein [Fulvivirgaceae bacterium PWU4]|uniref:DUF4249 family protein n=1 Tax=Chryseosolibacter histidini TaxID=2782349 RepID=A0AAP2DS87_9BACT|nr:DUF4249 domain-containing protein [Chryseosolibacter histidini]MBT1700262.1 DUF4249 family protein [Chryseosolibacter histidini]
MKLLRIIIPLLLLLSDGCIEPLNITPAVLSKIVVDGLVTNEPGPYTVKLTYSGSTDKFSQDAPPVRGATITIVENGSIVRPLYETGNGVYQTSATWQAQEGNTYEVRIITGADKEFRSVPQTLISAGSIDHIYTEFEEDGFTFNDDGSGKMDAINILVDAKAATPDAGNLRWRFKGVYHARTYPELYYTVNNDTGERIPKPWPCSGYIGGPGGLSKIGPCNCCECWPTELGSEVVLSNTQIVKDATYKKVSVHKIPVNSLRFMNLYRAEVEQLSLSPELYHYWKLVKIQQESAGSIFQPSAVRVRGNLYDTDDKEEVLGVFAVCGITRKAVYVDPSVVRTSLNPLAEAIIHPCKEVFSNATDKPAYWP